MRDRDQKPRHEQALVKMPRLTLSLSDPAGVTRRLAAQPPSLRSTAW